MEIRQADSDGGALRWGHHNGGGGIMAQMDDDLYTDQ